MSGSSRKKDRRIQIKLLNKSGYTMKRERIILMVLFVMLLPGCGPGLFVGRDSVRYRLEDYVRYLEFNPDRTFSVEDNYGYEYYCGEWEQKGDSVILRSASYRPAYETLDTVTQRIVKEYCEKGLLPSLVPEDSPDKSKLGNAYEWYFRPEANNGDRQVYLVRDRNWLYDPESGSHYDPFVLRKRN